MSTRFAGAAAIAACAIVLSACSEGGTPVPSGGSPDPTTTKAGQPTTTTAAQDDRYGAPEIDNPLDAAKQVASPCTSLTSAQLSTLGLKGPGEDDKDESAPSCSFKSADGDGAGFNISYIVANENGIVDLYLGQQEGYWEYWEPTTVNGYPGVFQHASDQRARGYCTISVGVNDQLHFSVSSSGADPDKACDQVKDIGAAIVDTMKSGG